MKEYFENTEGFGVLATADSEGNVNTAVYSRPHVIDDNTVAFVMADRMSHENLNSNGSACFLFREEGGGYRGKRLYLKKSGEEKNSPRIEEMRRRTSGTYGESYEAEDKFLVFFTVEKIRPLVGE